MRVHLYGLVKNAMKMKNHFLALRKTVHAMLILDYLRENACLNNRQNLSLLLLLLELQGRQNIHLHLHVIFLNNIRDCMEELHQPIHLQFQNLHLIFIFFSVILNLLKENLFKELLMNGKS